MPTTVHDIADALETWAPPASKLDYDNVGLQIGYPSRHLEKVLVSLDLTSAVVDEAVEIGAHMIITHHPLFFSPQKHLAGTDPIGKLALRMAEAGIAYYAIHTNLDMAHGGVSFALAEKLGLTNVQFLRSPKDMLVKLAVFVPQSHTESVRSAAAGAGAGHIGDYTFCSFETMGTGRFQAGEHAQPAIGKASDAVESVDEIRLEWEVMRWDLPEVIAAVVSAHPYEEVAYDVYPLQKAASRIGIGAVGNLETAQPFSDFLGMVSDTLKTKSIRYSGAPEQPVQRVAVCGGSGSSLIRQAISQGADAFVTADVTYHKFFDALDHNHSHQMAVLDVGHYESEVHTEQLIVDYLQPRFDDVAFVRTNVRTSPMQTFVR